MGGGHNERENTLNQLLVEMDGKEMGVGLWLWPLYDGTYLYIAWTLSYRFCLILTLIKVFH